ncbi:MAG: polymer-forming cytoskeletal protein [Sneathiella sp.]|nr:polymer-forming cytoskeletal protein [Sneathiella sp.]
MFSGTGDKKPRPGTINGEMPSIVAKGLVVTGNLVCEGELQIDGIVVGDIRAERLTLGETSHVTGDISASQIQIFGKVDGNLKGDDISIFATASVKGDVINSSLSIEPGAIIDGHCKHSDSPRGTAETVALFDTAEGSVGD